MPWCICLFPRESAFKWLSAPAQVSLVTLEITPVTGFRLSVLCGPMLHFAFFRGELRLTLDFFQPLSCLMRAARQDHANGPTNAE